MTAEIPLAPSAIPACLQNAGVTGAGGAGFPSYIKWEDLEDVDHLLINHQESEPNFYADKWLARERASAIGGFLNALTDRLFDTVIVGTKQKYRDAWVKPLEDVTEASICHPDALPVDVASESGVVVAYTPDVYPYS